MTGLLSWDNSVPAILISFLCNQGWQLYLVRAKET